MKAGVGGGQRDAQDPAHGMRPRVHRPLRIVSLPGLCAAL